MPNDNFEIYHKIERQPALHFKRKLSSLVQRSGINIAPVARRLHLKLIGWKLPKLTHQATGVKAQNL